MKAKHTTNKYSKQLKTHQTNIHQTLLTKGKQTMDALSADIALTTEWPNIVARRQVSLRNLIKKIYL